MKGTMFKYLSITLTLVLLTASCIGNQTGNLTSNITGNVTVPPVGTNVTLPADNASPIIVTTPENATITITPPSVIITEPVINITPPSYNITYGNVTGPTANLTDNVTTNATGNLTGNVTDNITGNVTGNATGNVTGDVAGNVTDNITGNVSGNVTVPTLKIIFPENGANLPQGNVTVSVNITNFNLALAEGYGNVPGEGQVHFYLDVPPPTTPGQPATPNGTWAFAVYATSYTFTNVLPGVHNISVQLVNNDHTPVIPLVIDTVTVNVIAGNVSDNITGNVTGNVTGREPGNGNGIGNGNVTGNVTGNVSDNMTVATLNITSHENGANVTERDITVTVNVTNFSVENKAGQPNVAGEGHLHFYLDVDAPTTPGQPAAPAGGVWAHVPNTTYTFTNVLPGTHTITVQLVNNDHTPLIPIVVDTITINVLAANITGNITGNVTGNVTDNVSGNATVNITPTLNITFPSNGANLTPGITIVVTVTNFNIVDKAGQANVPGEGHLHFYLDMDAPTIPGQPAVPATGTWAHVASTTYTFTNVSPGMHTVTVQLVNNDHTPIIPLATTTITIHVSAGGG